MVKKLLLVILAIGLMSMRLSGQTVPVRDLQFWSSAEVEKGLGKRWEISLQEQVRLDHNGSQLDEFFTEIDAGYDVVDFIKLSAAIRGIRHLTESGDFENRARGNVDLKFRFAWDRLDLGLRTRYQSLWEPDEVKLKNSWRNKIQVDYNLPNSKIDPYFYAELFMLMPGKGTFGYEGFRISAGVDWKLPGPHVITLFYMLDREPQVYYTFTTNRFGLYYKLSL